VHSEGTEVTIIGPGREDLEAIGGNLMDVGRRPRVIETSLRTSSLALADPAPAPLPSDFHPQTDDADLRAALAAEAEAASDLELRARGGSS
jgi:NTE family protein